MVTAFHDTDNESLILVVDGDVLSTTAETCVAEIEERLSEHNSRKWRNFQLDLRTARMVDSVGLNVIITLVKKMLKKKKPMKIYIASPSVKRVFEFSHLGKYVDIVFKKRRGW